MKKHHILGTLLLTATIALGVFLGSSLRPKYETVAQSSGTARLSYAPAGGKFTTGQTIDIAVMVSVNGPYNAATTQVYFNSNTLQYLGRTLSPAFNGDGNKTVLSSNGFGAYVDIYDNRTSGGPLTGSNRLMTLRFKALRAGNSHLNFGPSTVLNYPTTNYAISAQNSQLTVANPTPPPAPTPTPNPTPAPAPTPTPPRPSPNPTPAPAPNPTPNPAPRPSVITRPPAATAPPTSSSSETGQQITNLAVQDIGYKTATVTWNTVKPSPSKINFSTDEEDLYEELLKEDLTTEHRLTFDTETLQAGRTYYFRVSALDGAETVTIDGNITTKSIPVIIKVTDSGDTPLEGATVVIAEEELSTNEDGEVSVELPEGEQYIVAEKDTLYRQLYAAIEVPSEDEDVQRITLMLSDQEAFTPISAEPPEEAGTGFPWIAVILPTFLLIAGFVGFIIWRKKRAEQTSSAYIGDPLEAENYTAHIIPTTELPPSIPENTLLPDPGPSLPPQPLPAVPLLPENDSLVPHHTSLPEMLGRYGEVPVAAQQATAYEQTPQPIAHQEGQLSEQPVSPIGQPIPQHASLKDLVIALPQETPAVLESVDLSDLPIAPAATVESNQSFAAQDPLTPPDDTLTIQH